MVKFFRSFGTIQFVSVVVLGENPTAKSTKHLL